MTGSKHGCKETAIPNQQGENKLFLLIPCKPMYMVLFPVSVLYTEARQEEGKGS